MKYQVAFQFPDRDDRGHRSKEELLIVNSAGYEETDDPGGTMFRKNGRSDFYLAYNHAGKMKVKIRGVVREAEAGSVYLYKPYEEQYYGQYDKDQRMANYWVHFTGFGAADLLLKAGIPDSNLYATGIFEELPPLFESIITEIAERKPHFAEISATILQQIIFRIAQRLMLSEQLQQQSKEMPLSKALQFVHTHYMNQIPISQLADLSGLSVSRFAAVFKNHTGQSPKQYMIDYRMKKAKEFLAFTSLNIRQISALTGFDDQLYFSRLFHRHEGITPSEYRRASAVGAKILSSSSE